MAGIADLLAQTLFTERNNRLVQNPYYNVGQGLSNFQLAPNTGGSDMEKILVTALAQGLGGVAQGYGQAQATTEANNVQSEMAKALMGGEGSYAERFAKSPALAPYVPFAGLYDLENQQAAQEATRKAQLDMQKSLFDKGLQIGADGKIVKLPGMAEVQRQDELLKYDPSIREAQTALEYGKAYGQEKGKEAAYGGGLSSSEKIKEENGIRDEFTKSPEFQKFSEIDTNFKALIKGMDQTSGASDLLFVYGIANIMDPGSVVRDGEQLRITKTGGIPAQLESAIASINGKAGIAPDVRKNLIQMAGAKRDSYLDAITAKKAGLSIISDIRGLNMRSALPDFDMTQSNELLDKKGGSISKDELSNLIGTVLPQVVGKESDEGLKGTLQGLIPFVIEKESRGNPKARSPKGAIGIMQIMPEVGKAYGFTPEQLEDPRINMFVGISELANHLKSTGNNPYAAISNYNFGSGNVGKLLNSYQTNDILDVFPYLPKETQDYLGGYAKYVNDPKFDLGYGEIPKAGRKYFKLPNKKLVKVQ